MCKRVYIILCSFLLAFLAKGQINMTIQLPPSGVVLKSQLWNIALVNTGSVSENVYIELTLLLASDNEPVLNAATKAITVNKGAVQLTSADLTPIQYNYLSAISNTDRNPNGFLPIGNFMACYTIYKLENEAYVQLAEDCIPLDVVPLSPPLLNTPENEAVLETSFPQFSWIPPVPVNLFNDLSYDLILVEVLPGQDASEAIQQNIPIYNIGNYKSIFNNYPASAKSLDTAKTYAWRIVANNNNQFAAQSEVWTFTISSKQHDTIPIEDDPYIKLKRDYESAFTTSQGILKIEYENEANDSSVNYTITSAENGESDVLKEGPIKLKFGQNLISIEFSKDSEFSTDKTYQFSLTNSRNEQWSLKFSYNPPASLE